MKKLYSLYFLSFFVIFFCSCSTNKKIKSSTEALIKSENIIENTAIKDDIAIENIKADVQILSNDGMELLIETNLAKIDRLNAELSYLKENYLELESKSKFWTDPVHLYSKKIILDNGSNVFGNIIYQDNNVVHVETLIGTLSLVRESIIRVVDYQVENIEKSELDVVDIVKNNLDENATIAILSQPVAEIILFGEFSGRHRFVQT